MIKPLLFAVILPFAQPGSSTPLNALPFASECQPVTGEYIDFSTCGLVGRIAMVYELAPTEASAGETGDPMPEVKRNAEVNLFPNPVVGDNLYIEMSGDEESGEYEVRVYNILGRDIIKQPLVGGRNLVSIGELNEGIYFVDVVKRGRTIRTVKLIRK